MAGIKFSVAVPGLSQLGVVYHDASAVRLPAAVSAALKEVAEAAFEEAKAKAPHGTTGRLAGSLKPPSTAGAVDWKLVGGAGIKYFNAIHWGVKARAGKRGPHNIAARPFLFLAVEAQKAAAVAAGKEAIGKLVEDLQ